MNNYFDRDKREDWRAAFHAARDAAVGKNRDEVRELYLAELRSRGVSAPPDDYLELDITRIVRNAGRTPVPQGGAPRGHPSEPGPLDLLAFAARTIPRLWRLRGQLMPQYRPGHETKYIYPDRSAEPIQVVLEPGAGQWLAAGRHLPRGADPATRIDVWLDFTAAGADDRMVRVHIRDYVVGVLPPDDGDEFRAEIEDARRGGYYLMTSGIIDRRDESAPGFYVYRFAAD